MSVQPEGRPSGDLDRSEAYRRCLYELRKAEPDYRAAQVYATLSLEDAIRDMVTELAHLTRSVAVAARRR